MSIKIKKFYTYGNNLHYLVKDTIIYKLSQIN